MRSAGMRRAQNPPKPHVCCSPAHVREDKRYFGERQQPSQELSCFASPAPAQGQMPVVETSAAALQHTYFHKTCRKLVSLQLEHQQLVKRSKAMEGNQARKLAKPCEHSPQNLQLLLQKQRKASKMRPGRTPGRRRDSRLQGVRSRAASRGGEQPVLRHRHAPRAATP